MGRDFLLRSIRFVRGGLLSSQKQEKPIPLIATLAITSRCPLNCYHCSEGHSESYELPSEKLFSALDDLIAMGCPVIALTGGEPFYRRELISFLKHIPAWVTALVFTSGLGLTPDLIAELSKFPNLLICFSLDHSDPKEHDRRRGYPGSFEIAMEGIQRFQGTRPEIHVSTLVTRDRLENDEVSKFVRIFANKGVDCVQLFQPRPVGRLAGNRGVCLVPEEEIRLFQIVRKLNRDPKAPLVVAYPVIEHSSMLGCCGGYSRLHLDAQGNVCPCDFAPLSFGNISKDSLQNIWKRMRDFFCFPSNHCLVCGNPEIFGSDRSERNVKFSEITTPDQLRGSPPGLYRLLGEKAYGFLVSSLTLASILVTEWEKGAFSGGGE